MAEEFVCAGPKAVEGRGFQISRFKRTKETFGIVSCVQIRMPFNAMLFQVLSLF